MKEIIGNEEYRRRIGSVTGEAFLFFGPEDYLKLAALRDTRAALCPDEAMAFFNDVTIDFINYTPEKLLDAMTAPPMMSDAKLIVLRDFDFTSMRSSEIDALLETLSRLDEFDYNCIILYTAEGMIDEGASPKRPSAILKRLAEVLTPVQFLSPSDARLARWAGKHFQHHGVTAPPEVCAALVDHAGKSMFILANEIEKLSAYVLEHGRREVTVGDIRQVAVPAVLPDAFALSNAILAGDGKAALAALAVMKFQRVEPTVILGEIARIFSDMQGVRVLLDAGKSTKEAATVLKIHEFRVTLLAKSLSHTTPRRFAKLAELLAATDMQLKSTYADYGPIERLIAAL